MVNGASPMNAEVESTSSLKRVLTVSNIYDFFQTVIGGHQARKWIASEVWRLTGGEKVVDIGCGPGSSLDYLPADIVYCGIDISQTYIESARKKYGERGRFFVGSAADFPEGARNELHHADVVLSNGVLHHLSDEEAVQMLDLAKNILKPGGRLICVEPTYLLHQTFFSKWIISQDRGMYIRSEKEWKGFIEKAFDSWKTNVVTGLLRIPYTHLIIECWRTV